MKTSYLKVPLVFVTGVAIVTAFLAMLSLQFPRLLGKERSWDLNTGAYADAVFICGIKVSDHKVKSGLETIFEGQVQAGQTGFPEVVIYSSSIFQPPRGGQWMRIAHLAGRFVASSTNSAALDRLRLLTLIHAQDDTELRRWYYEQERDR